MPNFKIVICSYFVCVSRLQGASPTQYADKVDKAVCEHLEHPLNRAQVVQSGSWQYLKGTFIKGQYNVCFQHSASKEFFGEICQMICYQYILGQLTSLFPFQYIGLKLS